VIARILAFALPRIVVYFVTWFIGRLSCRSENCPAMYAGDKPSIQEVQQVIVADVMDDGRQISRPTDGTCFA
jgi:hypothetical protein